MRIESEIKKWGNSLALRQSGPMAKMTNFTDGTKVVIDISEDGMLVKRIQPTKRKLKLHYTEDELLTDLNPETAHADELAIPSDREQGE